MKLRFAFLGLLSLIAVSCSYEESFVPEDNNDNSVVDFYATIDEQPVADTKVYADENLKVLWNTDDLMSIFNKNTFNQEFRFTGDDGDNAGAIVRVGAAGSGDYLEHIYAVYPYVESTAIDASGTLSFTLPSEQSYHKKSFGIGANTMVSVTDDIRLRFKNVGGYLSLKFYGDEVSVSSIVLKGNNGELLSGPCRISTSSGIPAVTMSSGASDQVTLVCDPPVELGATSSEAIQFIFVLPPVTLAEGFTVTVTTPEGAVFEKSSSKKFEIGRSTITKLGAMEVVPEHMQPNNVIYYTSIDGKVVAPFTPDAFGASIVANEYIDGHGVITFDGSVTQIGDMAFAYCYSLASIDLPSSVSYIGYAAFWANSLEKILIPKSVTDIERIAFGACNLTSISVDPQNTILDSRESCNAVINTLDNTLLVGCQSSFIPESVTSIGNYAFYNCENLSFITIPSSVSFIGSYAFMGCSLASITIPESVTTIGHFAFSGLSSVYVPKSVIKMGYNPFGCLNSISVDPENPVYDSRDNCNAVIHTESNEVVSGCRNTIIPNSATSIGYGAFAGCPGLTEIIIPNSITSIGNSAFSDCYDLTSITLPESLLFIDDYAFYQSGLRSITIPQSVSRIGEWAFENCDRLSNVIVEAENPPQGESNMFVNNNCPIYVPAESIEEYRNAEFWNEYNDRIQPLEEIPVGNIDFIDNNFKAYCVANYDSNGDGEISYKEAFSVKSMDFCTDNIENIDEIGYFKNIISLSAKGSAGKHFTWYVDGDFAAIESLPDCEYGASVATGKLSRIDLSGLTYLQYVDVSNNNRITDLILDDCIHLTGLRCDFCNLVDIDIHNNYSLSHLRCSCNQLKILDVSSNTALTELWCYANQLSEIELCYNSALSVLNCSNNRITSLDIKNNKTLNNLYCVCNQLESLNVSNNASLTELMCYENELHNLDVSNNAILKELHCQSNHLEYLDVSKNLDLKVLWCNNNELSSLDVKANKALTWLYCGGNQLTSLDISKNMVLSALSCSGNKLNDLDVNNNSALSELFCGGNLLTDLNVKNNRLLTRLDCGENQLKSLDISENGELTELSCDGNLLSSLDVSDLSALSLLSCRNNPNLLEIWLKRGQIITDLFYDQIITTIKYKD